MNIEVKRGELPLKIARREKLKNILKKNKVKTINYKWRVTSLSEDEDIYDFHLFCVSIVKDLVKQDFKTNENGKMTYKFMEDINNEETVKYLHHLYQSILFEKNNNKT
jgi:hypothetical protein